MIKCINLELTNIFSRILTNTKILLFIVKCQRNLHELVKCCMVLSYITQANCMKSYAHSQSFEDD